jgi:hypothetical protein
MEIELAGGMKMTTLAEASQRMSMLLWGNPGCGKTVFAASAPGRKLLINFDPDGPSSLGPREDVVVLDLSSKGMTIVDRFNNDDPFGLTKVLQDEDNGFETVIVDSVTAFSQLAVEKGISVTKGATLERPSPGAYGARNAITLRMMTAMLRLTGKLNKNIIFISHEDAATTDDNGNVLYITMMLGGKLGSAASLQISEVWHMSDDGKTRKIMVRPGRMRRPMKTRCINASTAFEFVLDYDQETQTGTSLEEICTLYTLNNRSKLPIPNSADYLKLKQKLLGN